MSVLSLAREILHPGARLLEHYAAGEVPEAVGLVLSIHLETCGRCREQVERLAQAVSEIDNQSTDEPGPQVLEAVLARLDEPEVRPPPPAPWLAEVRLPSAVAAHLIGPRKWIRPGGWVAHTRASGWGGWRSFVLGLPKGGVIPQHEHPGPEYVAVLSGAFRDAGGLYRQGDFIRSEPDGPHSVQATAGPCICLVAYHGRLRWRSPLVGLVGSLAGL